MPKEISEDLILSIIDNGISSLGEKPKKMIISMLEQDYGFTKENITKDLTAFLGVLQSIFGLGYSFLDSIFRSLLEKATGEKFEDVGDFAECVSYLRRNQAVTFSVQQGNLTTLDEYMPVEIKKKLNLARLR
jgi:hypothetical protein